MDLKERARWLRREVFEMAAAAGQGHLASVLSEIEILVALFYGDVLNCDPNDPERDRVIVSKGHAAMGLYPILADKGYFPKDELDGYGTPQGMLRLFGNIDIPGIDATSGSLAHGIGIACGMCWAAKQNGSMSKTYVILSEGEMYEGATWESAMFAAHNKLDNLIVIVDRNRKIILGDTEDLLALEPIAEKWAGFGWDTHTLGGHGINNLVWSMLRSGGNSRPTAIIANTVKGKGISFMEEKAEWHYTNLTPELIERAREELS